MFTLAVWCGLCGCAPTVLKNFSSYAASLAGFTAAIIIADAIPDPNAVFRLAMDRAVEIGLSVYVCAGLVLDVDRSRRARAGAAALIAGLSCKAWDGFTASLRAAGVPGTDSTDRRRTLIEHASGLPALLDETVGESADIRARSGILQAATDGLFDVLSEWRAIASHLERNVAGHAVTEAAAVSGGVAAGADRGRAVGGAVGVSRCVAGGFAGRVAFRIGYGSGSVLAERTARLLRAFARVANGIALLRNAARAETDVGRGASARG